MGTKTPLFSNLPHISGTIRRGRIVWPSARAWRAREPQGSVGSNPTLSADFFNWGNISYRVFTFEFIGSCAR